MIWTTDTVLTRLIEAYGTIEVITGRVTPKQYGSAHPAMFLDPDDCYTGKNLDDLEKIRKEEQEK